MRNPISWLVVVIFMMVGLAGCGSDGGNTVVTQQPTPDEPVVVVQQKDTITFLSAESQILQMSLDENGNVKNLRDGGIEVKPSDGDYIVYASYRFGDWKTSPYKAAVSVSMKFLFSDLPNDDQWGDYWYVQASGKKFRVEISQFDVVEFRGLYYWISPENSSIEWGNIEDDSAQDSIYMVLDRSTMLAKLEGQFGCNKIFGTKLGSFKFRPGMKVVAVDGNDVSYFGDIVQGADGNLSYEVSGIPVVSGPYYAMNYGDIAPVASTIKEIFILLPEGIKVPFNMQYNTVNNDDESVYTWYINTYRSFTNDNFWVDQYVSPMVINYNPPYQN